MYKDGLRAEKVNRDQQPECRFEKNKFVME